MSESRQEMMQRAAREMLRTRRGARAAQRRAFKGIIDTATIDMVRAAKRPRKRYRPANARRLAREARRKNQAA